ncbi:2'-5' RNA ligase family protein [Sphingomonas sp. DT-207]|uniref:2'-5' RNA ligase family protein n=1 Tax=Sphingomonas sp. DT-207 TaxID=3396167 RepID=UPI003F1C2473
MIKPDPEQAKAIDGLRRQYDLARRYAADRFHITLVPFGDIRLISPGNLDLIRRAAASLQAEPFDVALNRISGNALVGSNMQALRDFQRMLVTRLDAVGIEAPDRDFDPHLSLTYEAWRQRNIRVSPVVWRAQELLLINSIHGKGHETVDRWPLIPRQRTFGF